MRVFRRPGTFDLCLSLFTSFGYFNDEENQKVLDNVGMSLKEEGILLHCTMRATAEHVLFRQDGIRISSTFDVRVYSIDELEAMLRIAGMRVKDIFGSLSGDPCTDESGRMVIVSVKQ
jgi:hypothetical protein